MHCDGCSAYDVLVAKNNSVTLVDCPYHARRKFVVVIKSGQYNQWHCRDNNEKVITVLSIEQRLDFYVGYLIACSIDAAFNLYPTNPTS